MKVKIKKLNKKAKIPFKTHNSDFCYDVVAVSEEEVAPNVWKYGLGFALEIERGDIVVGSWIEHRVSSEFCVEKFVPNTHYSKFNLSIDFRPRSSIYKTGMVLCNSCGTIDESYRGEVCAYFYHVMPNMPRYKVGDKIGQIKLGTTLPLEFEEVDKLSDTERGEGGFGSTGK